MILEIDKNSPALLRFVSGFEENLEQIRKFLSFTNKQGLFALRKYQNNPWNARNLDKPDYIKRLNALKSKTNICLLKEDNKGFYTYSGLKDELITRFKCTVINNIDYPSPKLIPWAKIPPKNRYYQAEAIEALLAAKHGAISLPTGAGKSFVLLHLAKFHGLKSLIVSPTESIAKQLLHEFSLYFGKSKVGFFGAGKKKTNKLITISIDESLTKVKPGSEAWEELQSIQVLAVDESHMVGAETLAKISLELCASAPFRYYISATQMRNDGGETLLRGIIGSQVYSKSLKDCVEEGFLARPKFRMVEVESDSNFESSDVLAMIRKHQLKNSNIYDFLGKAVNKSVEMGQKVLILIDQVDQIPFLQSLFKYEARYAFSGTGSKILPKGFKKEVPNDLVNQFNDGKFPILVGTSCIGMGSNIKPVNSLFLVTGGKSPVKVLQGLGRGTRLVPGKTEFNVFDFKVVGIDVLAAHADARKKLYTDLDVGPVEVIKYY